MKYLFCTDLTKDLDNSKADGEGFVTAALPASMLDRMCREDDRLEAAEKKYRLPTALKWVMYICLLLGLAVLRGLVGGKVSFEEGYQNAPALYWADAALFAVSALLWGYDSLLKARGKKSAPLQAAEKQQAALEQEALRYLGVPDDAYRLDVMASDYEQPDSRDVDFSVATLAEYRCFRREDALCLATIYQLFSIPLSCLTGISLIRKSFAATGWNKTASPKEKAFQDCGLLLRKDEVAGLSYCCALEFRGADGPYRLLFPAYELPYFQALTGLPVSALPPKGGKGSGGQKVRPVFYWRVPKGTKVSQWFSPSSDIAFRTSHPKLYVLLTLIGLVLFLLPMAVFFAVAFRLRPDMTPWMLAGFFGSLAVGAGLLNLVAAWMHQYLGHIVTLALVLGGAVLMVLGCIL